MILWLRNKINGLKIRKVIKKRLKMIENMENV